MESRRAGRDRWRGAGRICIPAEQEGVLSVGRRQGAAGATRGGHSHSRAGRGHRAGRAHGQAGDTGRTRSSRIILIASATPPSPRLSAFPSTACSIPALAHGIAGLGCWAGPSGASQGGSPTPVPGPCQPCLGGTSVSCGNGAGSSRDRDATSTCSEALWGYPTFHRFWMVLSVHPGGWNKQCSKSGLRGADQPVLGRSEHPRMGWPRGSRCHRSPSEPSFVSPATLTPFTLLLQSLPPISALEQGQIAT